MDAQPAGAQADIAEVSYRPSLEDEGAGADAWAKDLGQSDALDRLAGSITNRAADTLPLQVCRPVTNCGHQSCSLCPWLEDFRATSMPSS